jgi:hypothetical protein
MGLLDERGLEALVAAGCPCGGRRLLFRSYLDSLRPMLGGEPAGNEKWVHDGEKFVDGVFEVTCEACKRVVFSADVCPRCHAAGGLAVALGATNRWPVPAACPSCESEEIRYIALVPAKVVHDGRRADKPRTHVEPLDAGYHGYRVDCRDCGTVAELTDRCPLCAAPGPLRVRPG